MLTHERLKSILHYNPETGDFTYLVKTAICVTIGSIAGSLEKAPNGKRYWRIGIDYKYYREHSLAFFYMTGEWPKEQVDHQDGNGLHNWWDNLCLATQIQNQRNRKLQENNKSGVCGVCFDKDTDSWLSQISNGVKQIKLGRRRDKFEAICLRKSAENKFNYHENHGQVRPL